jgi:hypothetical protein
LLVPLPRHCALPGLVVGNCSDTAPTAQTEPEASLVEAFLQRQLLVAGRLLTAVPTAAFGVTVSTVNVFVQSTLAHVDAGLGVVGGVVSLNPVHWGQASIGSIAERGTNTWVAPAASGSSTPWLKKKITPSLVTAKSW